MTLNNLGVLYSDTRDFAAARDIFEEARDIYAKLAAADPQTYENALARTLNNLGTLYRDTREFAAARDIFDEARDIYAKLAAADPQTYESALAATLNNLGTLYRDTREFAAARGAYEDARDIYAKLAGADPQTYESALARTLNNLGTLYGDTREFAAARDIFEEARDIYAKLAAADPQTYENDLAMTLNNLGNLYRDTREFAAARGAYEDARDIYAKLAGADPQTYESALAGTLNNLGNLYTDTREFAAARAAYEEARDIYAKLAGADPQTYESDLAGTLNNLGILYRDTRAFAAARGVYEEAVMLAETDRIVGRTPLHLSKGRVRSSYCFLLSEACQDDARAFSFLTAQRDGGARSTAITAVDLAATHSALAAMGKSGLRPYALLAPNDGADENTMTLGLVTAKDCQWFPVPTAGWEALFLAERSRGDQRRRRALAREIWQSLPDAVQAILSPGRSQSHEILISGDPFWSAFPWELLRFGDGEDDYLGLHKALARCGSVLAPALGRQFAAEALGSAHRRIAIVAPHTTGTTPLFGVEREIEALETLVPQAGGAIVVNETGEAAHDQLMIEAIRAEPSILYFSGHGTIINNEELLVLHRDPRPSNPREKNISYFGADHLGRMASDHPGGPLFPNAPLIVMNSCLTGATRDYGGFREDLVHAFLDHGAGAVIATALPILDAVGEALGRALFDPAALAQPTVGSLVVEARRQLARGACADIDSVRWGAWGMVHIHGNADATPPLRADRQIMGGNDASR